MIKSYMTHGGIINKVNTKLVWEEKVKEESGKAGLKLNTQKTKIMWSGPITSWQIDGETMETVTDFIFLGSKITVDDNCSHEIKRYLLLGRKAMANLDSILKSRDITLPTKVHLVKAMFFPVVMYGCESWTIKKAEHQRIDAFELWCWKRLLRVPWTTRRSNQSIPKEISPEYSLEGLMLKLKLQYFGHLMGRTDSLENTDAERLKAGGEGDDRRWGDWMASTTRWTWVWASSRSWWWTGKPGMLQSLGLQSQTQLNNWSELNCACQSWVRAAEGDGNPQAFSAFLDSKGGSGIQRAQPTKRHGCRLLKVKASPQLCVNWWNGWRGSWQGTAMGSSRITNSRTFVCVPEETTLCKWEMGNHRIRELVHTGSGTRLLRLLCAYRSLNDSCCVDRCWCGCWGLEAENPHPRGGPCWKQEDLQPWPKTW